MVIMLDRLKCRLLNGWNRVFFHGPSLSFPSYCEEHGFCFDKEFYRTALQHRPIARIENVLLPVGVLRTALFGKKYLMRDSMVYKALKKEIPYTDYVAKLNAYGDLSHKGKDESHLQSILAKIETPEAAKWPIIVNHKNYILDGQHRACSYLFKFGEKKRVDCIRVFTVPEKNIYRHCSA